MKNTTTGVVVYLRSYHVIGRKSFSSNTVINNSDISRTHASIYWSDNHWSIKDQSRNGSIVNGKLLRKAAVQLNIGDQIQFGSSPNNQWEITDLEAPSSYLKSLTIQDNVHLLKNCLALPNENRPEIIFYKEEDKWFIEAEEKKSLLKNNSQIRFNHEEWMFVENEALDETIDHGNSLKNAVFILSLSADEEDIKLKIIVDGETCDLGRRSYNYLLLALTRKRLTDLNLGYNFEDQGWVSVEDLEKDVSRELGQEIDAYYLNLQIFRLRKQITNLKPYGLSFPNIIERRPGEIRFSFPKIKLEKENICIGEILY